MNFLTWNICTRQLPPKLPRKFSDGYTIITFSIKTFLETSLIRLFSGDILSDVLSVIFSIENHYKIISLEIKWNVFLRSLQIYFSRQSPSCQLPFQDLFLKYLGLDRSQHTLRCHVFDELPVLFNDNTIVLKYRGVR